MSYCVSVLARDLLCKIFSMSEPYNRDGIGEAYRIEGMSKKISAFHTNFYVSANIII
jgi:hypothetical protein